MPHELVASHAAIFLASTTVGLNGDADLSNRLGNRLSVTAIDGTRVAIIADILCRLTEKNIRFVLLQAATGGFFMWIAPCP